MIKEDSSTIRSSQCTEGQQREQSTQLRDDAFLEFFSFLSFFLQLLSYIEKLRTSVTEDLNINNVFYKKRMEELGQRLQEQNELIVTQRQQVHLLRAWRHCS